MNEQHTNPSSPPSRAARSAAHPSSRPELYRWSAATRAAVWSLLAAALLAAGCTTIAPVENMAPSSAPAPVFTHELLGDVLNRYVDDAGRVNYTALRRDPAELERYYCLVSLYSPESHPELFPTEQSRLAYWINGYNAAVLKTVLHHYPISSVSDVEPPFFLFFMPQNSGFFYFQRPIFGGESTSLYDLEKDIIRKRFGEPRIHFALNCASGGCPHLPNTAFSSEHLEEELDRETRKFLAEERNLRIAHEEQAIYLSSLLSWYEEDYLDWYRREFLGSEPGILDYVRLYLTESRAQEIARLADSYQIRFTPYDWRLNERLAAE